MVSHYAIIIQLYYMEVSAPPPIVNIVLTPFHTILPSGCKWRWTPNTQSIAIILLSLFSWCPTTARSMENKVSACGSYSFYIIMATTQHKMMSLNNCKSWRLLFMISSNFKLWSKVGMECQNSSQTRAVLPCTFSPNQNTHLPDHFGHAGIIDEEEQFTWLIHR